MRAALVILAMAACGGSSAKPAAEPAAPEPVEVEDAAEGEPPIAGDDEPEPRVARRALPRDRVGTIEGTVVSAPDQRPLAGVTVFVELADGSMISATTDDKGAYSLTGVPPGTHKLTFSFRKAEARTEVTVEAAGTVVVPVALPLSKTAPVIVN
jgi:hypothetical protein